MNLFENPYFKLALVALFPAIVSLVIFLLDSKTACGKMNKWTKQIIIGIIFGGIAILGTEFGIPVVGAQVNCRDAAVLCAGLFFGGPAGIIAGLIGGIERWIAVAWGIGTFTRVACSVSTALAGFIAAFLRKYFFEDKRPGIILALASGIFVEIFHMTMVFLTNLENVSKAIVVVDACMAPMVIANGLSVMVGALFLTLAAKEPIFVFSRTKITIANTIQRWLIVVIVLAFLVSTTFVTQIQSNSSSYQVEEYLRLAAEDVELDITSAIEKTLLTQARQITAQINEKNIDDLATEYGVAEINYINEKGIITNSTYKDFLGFDMNSGDQSREFMVLLDGKTSSYSQEYGPISYDASIYRKYFGVACEGGFVQVGYDANRFQQLVYSKVSDTTANKHVGENGFVIIYDSANCLVSGPNFINSDIQGYGYTLSQFKDDLPEDNTIFELELNGTTYYARKHSVNGYLILSMMDKSEADISKVAATYSNNFMEVLIFGILFVMIYNLIRKTVVEQLTKVTGSLKKITSGDLNEVVDIRTSAEFNILSDDINSTVDALKKYIDEASARIDADLAMAKEIQASALPSIFPAFPDRTEFDIYARMDTAKEVGGDFYDFYFTKGNRLNVLIADVSGKGIPAAMFMMRAKTQLQSLTRSGKPINEVFEIGNKDLCEGNEAGMFVTAWQGGLSLDTGLVEFTNAGHNPPLIKHNGKFEYLKSKVNLVLAGMSGVPYKKQEIRLVPGDVLYLYTDGVTEATDANNELYGEDRLLNILNSREFSSMKDLCDCVKEDVDKFVGDAPQFDDITMVALKYIGLDDEELILTEKRSIVVPAKRDHLDDLMNFVDTNLQALDCPMKAQTQIDIAVDEIFANIMSYAYPSGEGDFVIDMYPCKEKLGVCLKFIDTGVQYNPLLHEDPDISLSAEERGIGGLGILMVKKTMSKVDYEYKEGKNILTLTKYFVD